MPSGSNVYKVVFTYVEANSGQFSEVYYATGNTAAAVLPQPSTGANARLSLLDPSVTWRSIRVSNVLGNRDTATHCQLGGNESQL